MKKSHNAQLLHGKRNDMLGGENDYDYCLVGMKYTILFFPLYNTSQPYLERAAAISLRSLLSGKEQNKWTSNRPGRKSAGSTKSGLLVAVMTYTPFCGSNLKC